jgi:hypothetical protein
MAFEVSRLVGAHIVAQVASGRGNGSSGRARRGRPPGSVNESFVQTVLAIVKRSPGLRSEQIYQKLPTAPRQRVKAALAKMREKKMVKTRGDRRSMTYTA